MEDKAGIRIYMDIFGNNYKYQICRMNKDKSCLQYEDYN